MATQDHKFMTNEGWKDVRQFTAGTLLGVFPTPRKFDVDRNDTLILSTVGVSGVDDRLRELSVLPLRADSWQMHTLSRVVGYLRARGLRPKFDKESDKVMFENDVQRLGFVEYGHFDNGFQLLVQSLEADLLVRTPKWIASVGNSVKLEFLRGYLGGHGHIQFIDHLFGELGLKQEDIEVAYQSTEQMEWRKREEYERHVKAVSAWGWEKTYTWEEWNRLVQIKAMSLFVPLASTQHVRHCMISDITVQSDNHSFIGGDGFMVSNSAMGKQAVGVYMSNFNQRIDTMAHILNYPQKPLVRTKLSRYTCTDELPSGINAIVAIMTHTGLTMVGPQSQ